MNPSTHSSTLLDPKSLRTVARLANSLAKQLQGPARLLAYRIKAEACSVLIVGGEANANGIGPGGIIALDLDPDRTERCHIRRSHLSRAAQQIIDSQTSEFNPMCVATTKGVTK